MRASDDERRSDYELLMISYNWELNDWISKIYKYGITFMWFLYNFWPKKSKKLEGYVKIHNPQRNS